MSDKQKIIVVVKDGLVSEVLSNEDLDVTIIDYDTNGEVFNTFQVPQGNGKYSSAFVYEKESQINQDRVRELLSLTSTPQEMLIAFEVQYRDADNYKDTETFYFKNPNNLSAERIEQHIEENIGFEEPTMFQDLGLRSIAKMDNEYLPAFGSDHSFCEFVEVHEVKATPSMLESLEKVNLDIVMNLIIGFDGTGDSLTRRDQAREILRKELQGLG